MLVWWETVNIQIIGTRKSSDTRKAERFFQDRKVPFQFVDLTQRPLSAGELESIVRAVGTEELIDSGSKEYQKRGLAWMEYDPVEELLARPLLLRQPVVRNGKDASVGYRPEVWTRWLEVS